MAELLVILDGLPAKLVSLKQNSNPYKVVSAPENKMEMQLVSKTSPVLSEREPRSM